MKRFFIIICHKFWSNDGLVTCAGIFMISHWEFNQPNTSSTYHRIRAQTSWLSTRFSTRPMRKPLIHAWIKDWILIVWLTICGSVQKQNHQKLCHCGNAYGPACMQWPMCSARCMHDLLETSFTWDATSTWQLLNVSAWCLYIWKNALTSIYTFCYVTHVWKGQERVDVWLQL